MNILRALFLFFACTIHASEIHDWHEQRQFFEKHGYVWIKNFFSEQQVRMLRLWADEINLSTQTLLSLEQKNIPGTLIIVPEAKNPQLACRAEDFCSFYPGLYHFVSGTITSYIGHLLGEPYVLFKDKINFKWPGGGAFLPHQDFPAYEMFGPREHVTAMISIDRATLENGCLQVATDWRAAFAGDSRVDQKALENGRAVLPYIEGTSAHGSIKPEYTDKITWLPLETAPGDLVLISSYVPHYSEPNHSQKPRRAMFLTHNRLREGDHRQAYYQAKRSDPNNPVFHIGTPTKARGK